MKKLMMIALAACAAAMTTGCVSMEVTDYGYDVVRDADGNWHWADDAHIVGKDTVVVSCKAVPAPTGIRYAYRGFPMGNLYNEEGFPAAQFDIELK